MTSRTSFAPGKIILSGEYGVLFGRAGIAVPSRLGVRATFDKDPVLGRTEIRWEGNEQWLPYVERIVGACKEKKSDLGGRLTVKSDVPVGKGMGSSTALIIAVARALLGEDSREAAAKIEDTLNPGHSGFDFAAIWENAPILFSTSAGARRTDLSRELLQRAILIDTGLPGESTTELVAWMRGREAEIRGSLDTIGDCTGRLMQGEPLGIVMRDHHKAQVALGVVPAGVQELIADIEKVGGTAKVIGAGSRAGGAGMVLALGDEKTIGDIARKWHMPTMTP